MRVKKISRMSIRTVFALSFFLFIALPILIIFSIATVITLKNVREDSIDKIRMFHTNLISSIELEKKDLSVKLSHLMYANDGEILSLSEKADTDDSSLRYEALKKLTQALDYSLPPTVESYSLKIFFESGRSAEYKGLLDFSINKDFEDKFLSDKGNVYTTAFNASLYSSVYKGTLGDVILVAGISPGSFIDRSGKIKYVLLYQVSSIYRILQSYDSSYALGKNSIGYTALLGKNGEILSSARIDESDIKQFLEGKKKKGYSYITSEGEEYSILTIVKNSDLLKNYWYILELLIISIIIVLSSFILFLNLLLKNVINPVDKLSDGLKAVEKGELSIHIDATGVQEVRRATHSFNAMIRMLRGLISDYEDRISEKENSPERLFGLYIQGKLEGKALINFEKNYLNQLHSLIFVKSLGQEAISSPVIIKSLDADIEFSSKCIITPYRENSWMILYRGDSSRSSTSFGERLLQNFKLILNSPIVVVSSSSITTPLSSAREMEKLKEVERLIALCEWDKFYGLSYFSDYIESFREQKNNYLSLIRAVINGDLKNINNEKELLSRELMLMTLREAELRVLFIILLFYEKLASEGITEIKLLGGHQDYISKLSSFEDVKDVMLFTLSFLSQIETAVRRELNEENLTAIQKAKRYIADNYQSSTISLTSLSEYVGLNERYLSSLFSKEEGETFISYLTSLRLQKAKELLRGSTYRVYEIANMCGYQNAEYFNKMFRKTFGLSPLDYRKMKKKQ